MKKIYNDGMKFELQKLARAFGCFRAASKSKKIHYPEDLKNTALELIKKGLSRRTVADSCGIAPQSLTNWKLQQPEGIPPPIRIPVKPDIPTARKPESTPKVTENSSTPMTVKVSLEFCIDPLLKRWGLL